MKLKKNIKNSIIGVFVLCLVFFWSMVDFKLNIQSIVILSALLGLFAASGAILIIDSDKKWDEVFK